MEAGMSECICCDDPLGDDDVYECPDCGAPYCRECLDECERACASDHDDEEAPTGREDGEG